MDLCLGIWKMDKTIKVQYCLYCAGLGRVSVLCLVGAEAPLVMGRLGAHAMYAHTLGKGIILDLETLPL